MHRSIVGDVAIPTQRFQNDEFRLVIELERWKALIDLTQVEVFIPIERQLAHGR